MPAYASRAATSLHDFPNELTDKILSYLSVSDRFRVSQTARDIHDVAARRLYRHVEVSQRKARIFFKTVSESKERYGLYTLTLNYKETAGIDLRLSGVLFCEALASLPRLKHLILHIRPQISQQFLYMVDRRVINREGCRQTQHTTSWIPNYDTSGDQGFLTCLTSFTLHGDIKLMCLMCPTNITTVILTEPLDTDDLLYLAGILIGKPLEGTNDRMKSLSVTLHYGAGLQISSIIHFIGQCFPQLEELTIRAPILNPLNITQVFQFKPDLLAKLRSLVFNDWSSIEPQFDVARVTAIDLQYEHLVTASKTRQDLIMVRFGPFLWERPAGPQRRWELNEVAVAPSPAYFLPLAYLEAPLFWEMTYGTPECVSKIDFIALLDNKGHFN